MDINFEQKVRERAYHIWVSAGMAHGSAHEHWVIAEQAVANETGLPAAAKTKAVGTIDVTGGTAKKAPSRRAPAKAATSKTAAAKPAKAPKATTAKAGKSKH